MKFEAKVQFSLKFFAFFGEKKISTFAQNFQTKTEKSYVITARPETDCSEGYHPGAD